MTQEEFNTKYLNTIQCGDCLDVMATMPDGSVDLVLTDPPYECEAHTQMRRTRAQIEGRRPSAAMPFAAINEHLRRNIAAEAGRLCSGWALVFCQAEAVGRFQVAFGTAWRRAMVWVKPDASPQFTGDRPAMGYESICAAWCNQGRSAWNGGGKRGVFIHNCTGFLHQHPAQKPLELICQLMELFSDPSNVILDPFCGSGTTCVAAKMLGRRYIGIELSEEYCQIARERLAAVETGVPVAEARARQMGLFE